MKKTKIALTTLLSVLWIVSTSQSTVDIYKHVNLKDPVFSINYELSKQECSIMARYAKAGDSNSAEKMKEVQKIRDQYTETDFIGVGLIPIVVESEEAKQKVRKQIDDEIRRLDKIGKQKYAGATVDIPGGMDKLWIGREAQYYEYVLVRRFEQLKNRVKIGKPSNTGISQENNNSNLESEFLAEIAKINADIARINQLAKDRNIMESFMLAQRLCDRLRIMIGQQYFTITLKEIRKSNPSFTFSITPLADQITPEYWSNMRNRASKAYRNAIDAQIGLVYNEGIQSATKVEIPARFLKATFDLVTNSQALFSGQLWGSVDAIRNSYGYQDNFAQMAGEVTTQVVTAGEDAKDWKSYVGVATGFLSAYNGFKQTADLVTEYNQQTGLLKANMETVDQLVKSNKKLLREFDRYRAFIESHSSSIDCLNDKIMRIDLDKKTIKGDPSEISIWGTGLYDWTGEEFIAMIKESGEDLKNEYIYCDDFIKALQIAVDLANKDYWRVEEKLQNSGAPEHEIKNQMDQNSTNAIWFDDETSRLTEYYIQFCDVETNNPPDDIILLSTQVVPGVEDQDVDPNKPEPWEEETNDPVTDTQEQENDFDIETIDNTPGDLEKTINEKVKAGKTPAGLYIRDVALASIYWINSNPFGMTAWSMEWYSDGTSLQNGITQYINQGYIPMGISFTEAGMLYVLYIKCQVEATNWQLVESQLDLNTVFNDVQPYVNQSYVPVGITIFGGMYYTLLIQVEESQVSTWTIDGYEGSNFTGNIQKRIDEGMIPFGYLKEGNITNVLYVGF